MGRVPCCCCFLQVMQDLVFARVWTAFSLDLQTAVRAMCLPSQTNCSPPQCLRRRTTQPGCCNVRYRGNNLFLERDKEPVDPKSYHNLMVQTIHHLETGHTCTSQSFSHFKIYIYIQRFFFFFLEMKIPQQLECCLVYFNHTNQKDRLS